ncbi:hypothetical protein [Deinococcus xianganensis]|uniref:Uncharacterized protein n=1 Tax=Deinococcus xianganensis TaxID=1507289 RepID=A0A6I4YS92_9DEIO|nr:hypothetical protein [Deinococcus xianganensis]MXV21847.1 hypothetical protein [Deinococcus xianganensis]
MTELNDRQTTYLRAALEIDQRQERWHKAAFERGDFNESRRAAADWRAMPFGRRIDLSGQPATPLREACGGADEGSGATWAALERRGLVQVTDRAVHFSAAGLVLPHVTLTVAGRRAARALQGEPASERAAPGVLARSTWKALAAARRAGDAGVKDEQGGGWYGGIPWSVWLRLRNFKGGDLVTEFNHPGDPSRGVWSRDHFIRLSGRGQVYYVSKWAANHAAYPDIDAPAPAGLSDQQGGG